MKICYFADGESIHIVRWCKHFVAKGYEVHLISFKDVSIEGVHTHFLDSGEIAIKGGNWRVVFKYRKVKALLKEIQPDIFHAHYATSYGITGALCGYHPYVITPFGTDILISAQQSKIYKSLLKYAFSKADWINTLADHMSVAVQKMGVDMSKVDAISFGIDDEVFNDKGRNVDPKKFVITSTRNHEEVYNISQIIKALSLIKDKIPALEFRIAGDGSLRKSLESLANECGINSFTTFMGKIPQQEMVKLLNETNVFVSVPISDGNSLSLAEAKSCGALCIGSNIPGNSQWITNGENGFLVEIGDEQGLADTILKVYKDFDNFQRKAFAINKKMIKEKGVWKTNMDRVEKKYKELMAAK